MAVAIADYTHRGAWGRSNSWQLLALHPWAAHSFFPGCGAGLVVVSPRSLFPYSSLLYHRSPIIVGLCRGHWDWTPFQWRLVLFWDLGQIMHLRWRRCWARAVVLSTSRAEAAGPTDLSASRVEATRLWSWHFSLWSLLRCLYLIPLGQDPSELRLRRRW